MLPAQASNYQIETQPSKIQQKKTDKTQLYLKSELKFTKQQMGMIKTTHLILFQ